MGNKGTTLRKGLVLRVGAFVVAMIAVTSRLRCSLAFVSYILAGYSWAFIGLSSTVIVGGEAGEKKGTPWGLTT